MHQPVLLQEVVAGLEAKPSEVILDATVGGGGHSEALCRSIGEQAHSTGSGQATSTGSGQATSTGSGQATSTGSGQATSTGSGQATFVCLDADEDAIERSRKKLEACGCKFLFYQTNYRHLDKALESFGITGVNRALFDLGLSSFQLEESGRGFSFLRDEPLTMTFKKSLAEGDITAKQIVNEWSEDSIMTLLEAYGEEKQARKIARRIVEARGHSLLSTTRELATIVESVVKRKGKIHPATKTFQALRIAVNDEFQGLKDGLAKAWETLLPGGRIAVISFHSMEDRVVKDYFRELGKTGVGEVLTKKPIVPSEKEVADNPRARSAKLRIIEKATFPNVAPMKMGVQK